MFRVNGTSKSEKFPPPHQDGGFGWGQIGQLTWRATVLYCQNASLISTYFEAQMGKSRKVGPDSLNLMKSLMLDIARSGRFPMRGNPKEFNVSNEGKCAGVGFPFQSVLRFVKSKKRLYSL